MTVKLAEANAERVSNQPPLLPNASTIWLSPMRSQRQYSLVDLSPSVLEVLLERSDLERGHLVLVVHADLAVTQERISVSLGDGSTDGAHGVEERGGGGVGGRKASGGPCLEGLLEQEEELGVVDVVGHAVSLGRRQKEGCKVSEAFLV